MGFQQTVLDTNPIRFYRTSAGGVVTDLSASLTDISTVNGGWTNDGLDLIGGEVFTSLSSNIGRYAVASVGETPDLTGDVTGMAIFRVGTLPTTGNRMRLMHTDGNGVDSDSANNSMFTFSIFNNGGTVRLECFWENGSGSNNILTDTNFAIVADTVYCAFISRDNTANSVIFTVNGVTGTPITSGYNADPTGGSNAQLSLGAKFDGTQRFTGKYDAFTLWDVVLTTDQKTAIYEEALGEIGSDIAAVTTNRYTLAPQQHGVFHIDGLYWVFYPDGNTLKCKYGASLDSLSDSSTGLPNTIISEGLGWAVEVGILSGVARVWISASRDVANGGMNIYSAELTSGGLGTITSRSVTRAEVAFTYMQITGNKYDISNARLDEITALYVSTMERNAAVQTNSISAMRSFTPEIDSDGTDGGTYGPTVPGSANFAGWFKQAPLKFANVYTDSGSVTTGDEGTQVQTSTTIGGSKTELANTHTNRAYAPSSTPYHHGTECGCLQRIGTGDIYVAYHDDTDAGGRFGDVVLEYLDSNGNWSNISNNLVGAEVWHLALTQSSDGAVLFIFYIKNENTSDRGREIYCRAMNFVTQSLSAEIKVADIDGGFEVDVLVAPPHTAGNFAPLLYSIHDGSITGGTGTGGNTTFKVSTVTMPDIAQSFSYFNKLKNDNPYRMDDRSTIWIPSLGTDSADVYDGPAAGAASGIRVNPDL